MNEELLKLTCSHLPVGVVLFDKDGNAVFTNGKHPELGASNLFADRIFPDWVYTKLSSGEDVDFTLESDKEEGSVHFRIKIVVVRDEAGQICQYLETSEDISEKVFLENKLGNLKKDLMMALSIGKILAWEYDIKSKFFRVLMGEALTPELVSSEDTAKIIHPDDYLEMINMFEALSTGKIRKGKMMLRIFVDRDSSYHYFENEMQARADLNGGISYIIGTQRDVTDEKIAQDALKKTRQNLQLALEAGKMSVWDYDVETKFFSVINGIDQEKDSVSYDDHFNMIEPSSLENAKLCFGQVLSGEKEKGENIYKLAGKELYRLTIFFATKEDGVVTHVIGTSQDVSEKHLQTLALQRSKEELSLVFESGDLSAWSYDVRTRRFNTLYGKSISGDGMSWEENLSKLHPGDWQMQTDVFDALISGKESKAKIVSRYLDKDTGEVSRYLDARMFAYRENGETVMVIGTERDMTKDYLYQKDLEEYAQKMSLINEFCDIIQWDYYPDKHVLNTYTPKAILPDVDFTLDDYLRFVHPNDRQKVKETFQRADNKESDSIVLEIDLMIPQSSDYARVVIDGIPIMDKAGQIIKYTGIRRNIDKYVKLNRELDEKTTINKLILDNINTRMIFFTTDCSIKWSNVTVDDEVRQLLRFSAYRQGEFCHFLRDGKCANPGVCLVKKAISSRQNANYEFVVEGGNVVDGLSVPVFDSDNNVQGALLKLSNITQKKKYIENLHKAKEDALFANHLLTTIVERLPSALFIKDSSNDLRYIMANSQYCDGIGKDVSEIIGKTDAEIFDAGLAETFYFYDMMLVQGEKNIVSYETEVKSKEKAVGKTIIWQIYKSAIVTKDNKLLILGVAMDVTSMHNINKDLMAAREKAMQSDKLKTAFLANMSHEIRTPLNSIIGFSDLLIETDDPAEKEEYNMRINTNSEMLLRLVGDILDLSKIEAGTLEFVREKTDVTSYLSELVSTAQLRNTNPNVTLVFENPYESCYITIDKSKMGQVMNNFLNNAFKYTEKGTITAGYKIEDGGLKLYVRDTGVGIQEDKKYRVFNRFDKLDAFAQGTGLGLSIVKALSEEGGGKVGFESTYGVGSYFWSWKPFSDIDIIDKGGFLDPNLETEPSRPRRILVAEDNESNFMLTQYILCDYDVSRAKDGAEAVEKAAREHFDLIMMDVKMPVMNGLDATREIRQFDRDIPIIAVTANAFVSDYENAIAAGCNIFMPKPIKREELLRTIAKLLSDSQE